MQKAFLVALGILLGAGQSLAEETCDYTKGSNPCCSWVGSGNCDFAASRSHCNVKPSGNCPNTTDGKGVYSDACAAYLEKYVESWMAETTMALYSYASSGSTFLAEGTPAEDIEGTDGLGADLMSSEAWSRFDKDDGKCMGLGAATGTYIGLYNCLSPFEQAGHRTGCKTWSSLYGSENYVAAVRNIPSDGPSACVGTVDKTDEDADCAFNLFPDHNESGDGFQYFENTRDAFDTTTRCWYRTAAAGGSENTVPLFVKPYENYTTHHPVFGYTQAVYQNGTMEGAVLVLQYVADNPCYQKLCSISTTE